MLQRSIAILLVTILLYGCTTSYLKLPPQDNILKLKIENSVIKAESEKYGYLFNLKEKDNDKEYFQYQKFINQYKNNVEGIYISFDVTTGYVHTEVNAQYNLIINSLNNIKIDDLKNQYRVVTLKNDINKNRFAVQFQATGIIIDFDQNSKYGQSQQNRLDDTYRLQIPIPVRLNDKTKTLSAASAIIVTPFYPIILMHSCMKSRCI